MDFEAACRQGEQADELFAEGAYGKAGAAYMAILKQMDQSGEIDSFLISKVTLGVLISMIMAKQISHAFSVWTQEPDKGLFGMGIMGLEGAQVNVHDTIIYQMACACLHAYTESDQEKAAGSVAFYLRNICKYGLEHDRDLAKQAISMWKALLMHIFKLLIPNEYTKDIESFEKQLGETITAVGVTFPKPSPWVIDWGSAE
jgi:hypothetical protein